MRHYLAGPMSNIPQFNIPLFDYATAELRKNGMTVTSPAELDGGVYRKAAMASVDGSTGDTDHLASWGDMLSRDVKMIADDHDALIMLPHWQRSSGAKLEAYVGVMTKKKFYLYQGNGQVIEVSRVYISEILANALTSN